MDVQPALLPLAASTGGPPGTGSITISEIVAAVTPLDVDCSLGTVTGSPGVTISVPPFAGQILAGGMMTLTASCSGTAAGFANATYTCVDMTMLGTPNNDNTVIDCTVTDPPAQLAISGTTDPLRPGPSDPVDLVITVQNAAGVDDGLYTVVVNNETGGVDFAPINDANWNCFFSKGTAINCDHVGPPLAAGGTVELRLPGTAPMGGVAFSADAFLSTSGVSVPLPPNPITIQSGTAASLSLNVVGPPDPSPAGSTVSYSVTVMNQDRGIPEDGAPARNAGVRSFFESSMSGTEVFLSGTGANWSCTPMDLLDSTSVNCSYGPDIPVGVASSPLTMTFSAPTVVPVNFNSSFDPAADNYTLLPADGVIVTTGIVANADLSITKSASVATANVGDPIKYTIDVTNNGPSALGGGDFSVTDVLPPRVAFAAANGLDFACMEASGTVTCDYIGSSLSSGSMLQIEIDVTAIAGGNTINSASVAVTGSAVDPNPGNDAASAAVNINPLVDLAVTKSVITSAAKRLADFKGPAVVVGDAFSYSLLVTNMGPDAAPAFTVGDALPSEVNFVAASGAGFSCGEAGGVVTCAYTGAPLVPGGTAGIDIDVSATSTGTATNSATVTATGGAVDANPGDNTSNSVNTVVGAAADLALSKMASANNVTLGDSLTYTLAVTNNGPSMATAFSVTDTLPGAMSFNSAVAANFACGESAGVVTCNYTGSGLAAGQTASIDINVTATSDGSTSNTASVTADIAAIDANLSNNGAAAVVVVGAAADLSLMKNASVANAAVGNAFSYTLDVANNGPSAVASFVVEDNLPAEVSFVATSATDFNCGESAGLVTCNYAGNGLAVGQTSSITIDVMAATNGSANNSATVLEDAAAPDPDPSNNTDAAIVPIGAATADLRIAKRASVSSARVGEGFDFVLEVSNAGPATATSFSVRDPLPSSVSFAGAQSADFDCSAAGQMVTCAYQGQGLAAGQTSSITLGVSASRPGSAANTATVSADAQVGDPDDSNNDASATVAISARPRGVDLDIDKSAVATIQTGIEFNYLIRVSNAGDQGATGVRLSDTLPPGMSFLSATGADWNCQDGQGTVNCSYVPGTLEAGETSILRLAVVASAVGSTVNTASVSLAETDVDPGNNTDSAPVEVTAGATADLALVKTSVPDAVSAGAPFEYRFEVSNAGPDAASLVVIADTLPPGVQLVSASAAGWNCGLTGERVDCELDSLDSGASSTLSLSVLAPQTPGTIVNVATVSAAQTDPNPGDNQSSAQTLVNPIDGTPSADVSVLKEVDRASANQGDVLGYTLTASNAGPNSAAGVTVSDVIPQGLALGDISAPGWSCAVTTAQIVCDLLQDLAPGASAAISLTAQVLSSSGSIVNQAVVSSQTADPNPGNNGSSATTAVTGFGAPADLEVSIDDSPDPVLTGDALDYFVTLRNNGPGRARGVRLTGTLPIGGTVISFNGPNNFACSIDGNLLGCQTADLVMAGVEYLFTLSLVSPSDDGVVSLTAEVAITELGLDDNLDNNVATEDTTVRTTPTEAEFSQALLDALGGLDDPVVTDNLLPTAALCGDPPPPLVRLCREIAEALAEGRESEVADVIRQLIGRQSLTQHTSLVEANASQFRNIDARQAFNRGGGGGGQVSLNGLNFRYGNEVLPLSFLQVAEDTGEAPEISSAGLIKPWGFFINGTLSGGEKDPTTREIEFDFDTYGLTAGVDYRFSTRLIGGAAIGYADFDSDSPDGSELKTDGFTYHLFASYYPRDRFYIDGRISYGKINLDQRRPIRFTIGDLSVDEVASADADADQFSGALGFGLLLNKGGWSFAPRASISFMDAQIDGFSETGTDFSLNYEEQDVESLIISAGFSASKVISLSRGVLTPQFDLSFEHESRNDDNAFSSQIIGAAAGSAFFIDADDPDRNYANAGVGLVFIAANGRQAFLSYRKILGLGGFTRWTVNAGLRFEF